MWGDRKQLLMKELLRHPKIDEMVGPKPQKDFVSNGCSFSPDILLGVDLRPACLWHDFAYDGLGGTELDRAWADRDLLANLQTCGLPRIVAGLYYAAVRFWGHTGFTYNTKPKKRWAFWVSIIASVFIRW